MDYIRLRVKLMLSSLHLKFEKVEQLISTLRAHIVLLQFFAESTNHS